MSVGNQHTIPTEPMDVYRVLQSMLRTGNLPTHQHAAIAYALGAMQAAFPVSIGADVERRV